MWVTNCIDVEHQWAPHYNFGALLAQTIIKEKCTQVLTTSLDFRTTARNTSITRTILHCTQLKDTISHNTSQHRTTSSSTSTASNPHLDQVGDDKGGNCIVVGNGAGHLGGDIGSGDGGGIPGGQGGAVPALSNWLANRRRSNAVHGLAGTLPEKGEFVERVAVGNHKPRLASLAGRDVTDVVLDSLVALVREQVELSGAGSADDESLTVGEDCSHG